MAAARKRPLTILLAPRSARTVAGLALVSMHGWFLLKLTLPSEGGAEEILTAAMALFGLVSSVALFVSNYGVLANSPDERLDEWQILQRSKAYIRAFQYVVAMIFVGLACSDILERFFGFELSIGIMENYLVLIFATAIVLPAALLAFWDRTLATD